MEGIAWKVLAGAAAASVLVPMSISVTLATAGFAVIAYALQPPKTIQR